MNCNDNGFCVDGVCKCNQDYYGAACEHKACFKECNYKGKCLTNGTCVCDIGYEGFDCGNYILNIFIGISVCP